MTLNPYREPNYPRLVDLGLRVARAHDQAIINGVASGCPFPVVVLYVPDYDRLDVRAAGTTLARVDRSELLGRDPRTAILYVINRALLGYAAFEPLPHDHPLGQD